MVRSGDRRGLGFSRKGAVSVGVSLALVFVLGSTAYVYTVSKGYQPVYSGEYFNVYLRIDKVNIQPQKFAIVTSTMKAISKTNDDITVHEFSVWAYSDPPAKPSALLYGKDSVYNFMLPAKGTKVMKLNEKISYYEMFLDEDSVWVRHYIKWTHLGKTYEKGGVMPIEVESWIALFGLK